MLDYFPGQGEYRRYIGKEHALEFFIRHLYEVFFLMNACIVHQDVDTAACINDLFYEGRQGRQVIEILAKGMTEGAELFAGCL